MYSVLLLSLDIPLISKEPINHIYSISPSPAIWIFFIIFPIINIWLISSALYIQRVHDRNLLLFGKFFIVIFSGIPIWGLLAFPIYSYLISNDIFSQPSYPYKSNTKIKLSFLLRKYIDILC